MPATTLTVGDLNFDEAAHRTTTPDGRDVPHVTTVLSATNVGTDFAELEAMGGRHAANIELARKRGQAVHADCHALDDNDLDLADVDDRVRPYVEAYATCLEMSGLVPVTRERRLFHPVHWYTGAADGIYLRGKGRLARRILGDIKTGDPKDAAAHLQTSAYARAWDHLHPDQPIQERWAIWLVPGRVVPYRIVDYTSWPDAASHFPTFAACLAVYAEQQRRARRPATRLTD
jgi:hypothetical protein